MKTKKYFLPILLLPLFINGCVEINEEFSKVRDKVIDNFGDDYKSEVQFSIGSVGLTISSWIIDSAQEDELPSEILDNVSSVQVGIYKKVRGYTSHDINTLKDIESNMQESGWKSIVRSSTEKELTAVYVRKNVEEMLDRLFIINLEDDELVLVEVEGDLSEVIATVIKEKRMKINI
jgi:hypothetical protein